jgi:hypothetical protein
MLALDTNKYKGFSGSKPQVKPANKYDENAAPGALPVQELDALSGLPLWKAPIELINEVDGSVEPITLKIASAKEPVIQPRTDYTLSGDFVAAAWLNNNRPAISYKLIGELVAANGGKAFPPAPKADNHN